ncbi:three-Cys-motif partner protein TcmP [bacterium]|nr:three-Cys-motif partner protein TcmP [bacterium]
MVKDLNKKPYDEATLTKLEIFEQYLKAWLPVFIQTPHTNKAMICDFCAGSGYDSIGTHGSPIRIVKQIDDYRDQIFQNDIHIDILLNDVKSKKYRELENTVAESFQEESWQGKITLSCRNEDFQQLFRQQYKCLKQQPNLIFIDQSGVRQVTNDIFQMLIDLNKTDFLFFISSSAIKRFAGTAEFRSLFPDIDSDEISGAKHEDIHRIILDYYTQKIPKDNPTRLYPFSLKKGPNIYGLIFGSKHPLGVEKFLDLAWDQNAINGEANFDIDDDVEKRQPTLFDSQPGFERRKTKRELFEDCLKNFIHKRGQVTNRDVYYFTLNHGHPKSHAGECIRRLKKEGKVEYSGRIGFSYNSCGKKNSVLKTIKWITNG